MTEWLEAISPWMPLIGVVALVLTVVFFFLARCQQKKAGRILADVQSSTTEIGSISAELREHVRVIERFDDTVVAELLAAVKTAQYQHYEYVDKFTERIFVYFESQRSPEWVADHREPISAQSAVFATDLAEAQIEDIDTSEFARLIIEAMERDGIVAPVTMTHESLPITVVASDGPEAASAIQTIGKDPGDRRDREQ
jgi:hypothetical protein